MRPLPNIPFENFQVLKQHYYAGIAELVLEKKTEASIARLSGKKKLPVFLIILMLGSIAAVIFFNLEFETIKLYHTLLISSITFLSACALFYDFGNRNKIAPQIIGLVVLIATAIVLNSYGSEFHAIGIVSFLASVCLFLMLVNDEAIAIHTILGDEELFCRLWNDGDVSIRFKTGEVFNANFHHKAK